MSLPPPEKVQKLQETLHAKAKRAPSYRFYALYDKVYGLDVLDQAYLCCAVNGGAAGVDGQTFDDIAAYGVYRWLGELAEVYHRSLLLTADGSGLHWHPALREKDREILSRHP